ncbi:MAG TPA: hypothetical protein VHZ51_17440 [Ktedonobacteraceae bacterium]|jgi:ABC-type uncharacterized transport system auxiliary subunit|nr:hypothetical protein [Ktedonobacteraceae bacterium]
MKRWLSLVVVVSFISLLSACGESSTPTKVQYIPQSRSFTIVTVPLLTKEQQSTYPFLQKDPAKGGVLEGKEVTVSNQKRSPSIKETR